MPSNIPTPGERTRRRAAGCLSRRSNRVLAAGLLLVAAGFAAPLFRGEARLPAPPWLATELLAKVLGALCLAFALGERRRPAAGAAAGVAPVRNASRADGGVFAASLAHELVNPLTALLGRLEPEGSAPPLDPREAAERLAAARADARRMSAIVGGLSRLWSGAPDRRAVQSLGRLAGEAVAAARALPGAGEIVFRAIVEPGLDAVRCDPDQLRLAVDNLLANARDAVRARRGAGQVTVRVRPAAERVVLEVEDDGVGLEGVDARRLFALGFTTKRGGRHGELGGEGVGLYLARRIALAHGGALEALPRAGGGAQFRLVLPLAERAARARSLPRGRWLVVDDEPAVVAYMVHCLGACGQEGVAAADSAQALELLARDGAFAGVFADACMPGLDGAGLYRAALAVRPELAGRFVFVTGDLMRSMDLPEGNRILLKPFGPEQVRRVIEDGAETEEGTRAAARAPSFC